MLDLIKKLSMEDNELIKQYLLHRSQAGIYYCGNETFLTNWAKSKKTLYHLLGGNFIVKKYVEIEKDKELIKKELRELMCSSTFFDNLFYKVIRNLDCNLIDKEYDKIPNIDKFEIPIKLNCSFENTMKFKIKSAKKTLQIGKGCAPMKACGKFVNYLIENIPAIKEWYPDIMEEYEEFRNKHSLILNEKLIKGNLVVSIHPLDFLTMSNNASGWSSCMYWGDNSVNNEDEDESGCYHLGTIEMMNSNNVVCCYFESKTPYEFYKNEETGESYSWNNKRWRSLAIVNKDIIVSGKSYPYQNNSLANKAIDMIRDLARENCGWTYQYQNELYKDMKHINSIYTMDRARNWIYKNNATKKNILFDTNAMYNDMLNDKNIEYWCHRNKVKSTKVISISGKSTCTCCGGDVIQIGQFDSYDEYNDRYERTGEDICLECYEKIEKCNKCKVLKNGFNNIKIKPVSRNIHFCFNCFIKDFNKCPKCNKIINKIHSERIYFDAINAFKENDEYFIWELERFQSTNICDECAEEIIKTESIKMIPIKTRGYFKMDPIEKNQYYCIPANEVFPYISSPITENDFISYNADKS